MLLTKIDCCKNCLTALDLSKQTCLEETELSGQSISLPLYKDKDTYYIQLAKGADTTKISELSKGSAAELGRIEFTEALEVGDVITYNYECLDDKMDVTVQISEIVDVTKPEEVTTEDTTEDSEDTTEDKSDKNETTEGTTVTEETTSAITESATSEKKVPHLKQKTGKCKNRRYHKLCDSFDADCNFGNCCRTR